MTDATFAGIDHVQLAAPAGCEPAAREFFGALLGLDELDKPPALALRGGCWFKVGAQQLHIGVTDQFAPAAKAHPAFRLGGLAALHRLARRLGENGVSVTWADAGEIPGVARFFAADPWGNRLEFLATDE